MVLVQKWPFFQFVFRGEGGGGNIGQGNVFYDILERKNAFPAYKNNMFKKSSNWQFSKGLNLGFGPNMAIFPTFFLKAI